MLQNLLKLQVLDSQINARREREAEIPNQKNKFDIYRERLKTELEEREKVCQDLALEQQDCESAVEQHQAKIDKYNQQLAAVKKNEEYQALLHEIDQENKQIGLKEERILFIMDEMEQAQARLDEDRKRIGEESADIDRQCSEIDRELEEMMAAVTEDRDRPTSDGAETVVPGESVESGTEMTGTIVGVSDEEVFLEFGAKCQGVLERGQFGKKETVEVGRRVDIVVDR